MNINFPQLNMSKFPEQFSGLNLTSMHATNPQPFSQRELEHTIGQTFNEIIQDIDLGFSADQGTISLRKSIARNLYKHIKSENVIVHAGAQEALYCAFCSILESNDKVLVITPIYEPLDQIPLNLGCDVSYLPLNSKNNWSLDLSQVEANFKQGCKMFVINFPHNPTGVTISKLKLNKIIELCKKYNVWLLSDEVFRGLEHEKKYRLPAVADIYKKGISIGVISKAFAVPGLRIGWLVCQNQTFIQKVINIKGYLSICNSQIDEILVSNILNHSSKLLNRNLKIILSNKKKIQNLNGFLEHEIKVVIPNSGCCFFAELVNGDDEKLVIKIAQEQGYLLYPSSLFKTHVNGMRIGFGSNDFARFLNQLNAF